MANDRLLAAIDALRAADTGAWLKPDAVESGEARKLMLALDAVYRERAALNPGAGQS